MSDRGVRTDGPVRVYGWSWGPEPRKLLQSAVNALPELIARELAGLWPDDAEIEIAARRAPAAVRLPDDFKFQSLIHAADERIPADAVEFGAEAILRVIERF